MKELFPVKSVKMLSPRLIWVKKHKVKTERTKHNPVDRQWRAWSVSYAMNGFGYGDTEENACRDLGVRNSVKLWNELP